MVGAARLDDPAVGLDDRYNIAYVACRFATSDGSGVHRLGGDTW
jgi:hypothetical protein